MPSPWDSEKQAVLDTLAEQMRRNSERWFPGIHVDPVVPLHLFYAIGLSGEAGEQLDEIKKTLRSRIIDPAELTVEHRAKIGAELADVFTYLLLLADELGLNLVYEYQKKAKLNEDRFG